MTGADKHPLGRREALTRIGAAALGILGGIALLPGTPVSPDPVAQAGNEGVELTNTSEAETPYAVWHYQYTGDGYEPTAPINVVFPLEQAAFIDVIDVFREANWYSGPEEYARYAYDRATDQYVLQQWTGAETFFGKVGRYHVRCWHTDGTASIQAHRDTAAAPKHGIDSYAAGRAAVVSLFERTGWRIADTRLPLGNQSTPDHDGWAAVIRGPGRE